jgi:hypothetical protein
LIPVHPDLAAALTAWRRVAPSSAYVIASERGGRHRPRDFPLSRYSSAVFDN